MNKKLSNVMIIVGWAALSMIGLFAALEGLGIIKIG